MRATRRGRPPTPAAADSPAAAAAAYAATGLFWMEDVLDASAVATLAGECKEALGEVLRHLLLKDVIAQHGGTDSPPVAYSEVVQRTGGRYDSRHRMAEAPFSSLLRRGGLAAGLIPALKAVLGDEAEVVAVGQIVAMSPEWELLEEHADQAWHTDGRGNRETDALTVFLPLVESISCLMESKKPMHGRARAE